jgi:p24 family protein delta-1
MYATLYSLPSSPLVEYCFEKHQALIMTPSSQIRDAVGNEYGKPKDVAGEQRVVFTSHADAAFDVCFENILSGCTWSSPTYRALSTVIRTLLSAVEIWRLTHQWTAHRSGESSRHIELDIDIGADAKDWSAIQATEKLKPVETELRRIEELIAEIVGEMDYLRGREQKLRDTNESTNTRVKWFGFMTTFLLIALWAWQIMYLRAYFRYVLDFLMIAGDQTVSTCTDTIIAY